MASSEVGKLSIALTFNNKEFDASLSSTEKRTKSFGETVRETIISNIATKGFNLAIDSVKNFASSIVNTGMKFEKSMSEVAAITGATEDELSLLEQTARDFGASTTFSASEAADALKYMGLAGWSAEQSSSALGGVLDLAAASGMELAQASDMVTDYLSAFGMQAEESAYFADMLTYAQNNSNTTAEALGEAYKNCAANLNAAGQDVETTTSLLAMMANQGLKGSEAGTALNAIMRDMTAKMKNGAIAIGKTNVQVMDANGNYRDMTDILADVEKATEGMGDAEKAAALSSSFTSDSIKGLNLIMNAGVGEASAFEEALRGSEGAAAETAKVMNNNLAGKMAGLNSKMEELQIKLYDAVQPALMAAADVAGVFADGIGWVIDNANWLLPILGILTAAFVAYQVATNGAAIVQGVLTTATNVMAAAQAALNLVMSLNPIGLVVAAIVALIGIIAVLWNNCEGFRNFIMGVIEAIGGAIGAVGEFIGGVFQKIGEIAAAIFGWIGEFISGVVDSIVGYFEWWWETVSAILGFIGSLASNIFGGIRDFIGGVINWISGAFTSLWENIKNNLSAIGNFFKSIFDAVWGVVSGVVNAMKNAFQGAWNFITGLFGQVASFFGSIFSNAWNNVKNIFSTGGKIFSGIVDGIANAFRNIVNAIINGINRVVAVPFNAINGFLNTLRNIDILGIRPFGWIGTINVPQIPTFATGGIVGGDSYSGDRNLARVNSGEMVITRSQQAALWEMIESGNYGYNDDEGLATGVTDGRPIEINNNYEINSTLDAEEVGDLVLESIRRAVI